MLPPDVNVVMPRAPRSAREAVSVMLPSAVMADGSVMSSIWTPSSESAATAAYVLPPDSNTAMSDAPPSSREAVLAMLPSAVMADGSVTLSIWTPSKFAATAA